MNPARRLVGFTLAGALAFVAWFLFGFGGCHSGGGFCTGGFTSTNRGAYVLGVAAGGAALATLAGAFEAGRKVVLAAAVAGVAVMTLLAFALES